MDSHYPDDEGSNARLLAEAKAGSNAPALSVSEISNALKRTVEDRFGHVRVRGELSGVKRAASGHLYFSLKDADAKLDGVMWKGHAGRLSFAPEDGLEIIATGKLTTYAGRSSYQIVADRIELAGEGALMMLFEKLKARLAAEGLFDTARKRPIPYLPRTIGIVTSPTGAVIRDMMHRLEARFPSHVVLWPVLVQGDNAAAQIAAAIRGFADMSTDGPVRRPDLLIVARGGGSIEDLWAFNEEPVVRAVADCPIPVISAVGHETDTTLCDYAADLRAPTPSAAAEMAVPVRLDLAQRIAEAQLRLAGALRRFVERARDRLATQERLLPSAQDIIAERQQRADELGEKLRRGLERRSDIARIAYVGVSARLNPALLRRPLDRQRDRLEAARLNRAWLERKLADGRSRLSAFDRLLTTLHPEAPLLRGFARVTTLTGETIADSQTALQARTLRIKFRDGSVDAAVSGIEPAARATGQRRKPVENGQQEDLFGES
ncbi:MAG: exodeoxyribonuclease VII large subunit [Sphingomonadaceae bacterium]|nr:exodeoxyribonuclease VII large subunit [Sphingomonadaceae bacterium]